MYRITVNLMKRFKKSHLLFALTGILLVVMIGCGSSTEGENPGAANSSQVSRVALLVSDLPAEEFSAIHMTVKEVSLLSEEGGPVVIFSGERRIDFLALEEDYDLFSIAEGIPAGTYTKIRLEVSDPEFVTSGGEIIKGEQIHLTANGKVDLVPDSPFQVVPGNTIHILLDMDTNKSILMPQTGESTYQFLPIVHIKIRDELKTQRISLNGTVVSIDAENKSFLLEHRYPILCLTNKDKDSDDPNQAYYTRVFTTADTSIFESNGEPGSFDSLTVGHQVFVRGSITDGGLYATARLIKIGTFIRLNGYISTGINDNNQFGLTPAPAQGVQGDLMVQVFPQTMIFEEGTLNELSPADLVLGKRVTVRGVIIVGQESVLLNASIIKVKQQPRPVRLEGTINDLNLLNQSFTLIRENDSLSVFKPAAGVVMHIYLRDGNEDSLEIELIPFSSLHNGDKVDVIGIFEGSDVFRARVVIIEELSSGQL